MSYRTVYSTDPDDEPKREAKAPPAPPPQQQTLYVERDRKGRKGKTVTVITGLQAAPAEKEKLLKRLKGLCGAGGTLKEGALEIQGDHRDRLIATLREMGYQVKQKGG